jgi:hypothetical protein
MSEADQADILTPPEEVPAEAPPAPAEEFQFKTLPPEVSFATRAVPPPGACYIAQGDHLYVEVRNAVSGGGVYIEARLLLPDGRLVEFQERVQATADRALCTRWIPLAEGFFLTLHVRPFGAVKAGGLYARVLLVPAGPVGNRYPQLLAAGYPAYPLGLTWPYPRYVSPCEGPGRLRYILGTDPAPGYYVSEAVPTGVRWKLVALGCDFTTGPTVVDRWVSTIIYSPSGYIHVFVPGTVAQPASQTRSYYWAIGVPYASGYSGGVILAPLPDQLYLPAGMIITIQAGGVAGDDFGPPRMIVEEWVEP